MSVLLWLVPIPIAAGAAAAWVAWSSRARRPDQAYDTVAAHERFRAALSSPTPPSGDDPVAATRSETARSESETTRSE